MGKKVFGHRKSQNKTDTGMLKEAIVPFPTDIFLWSDWTWTASFNNIKDISQTWNNYNENVKSNSTCLLAEVWSNDQAQAVHKP